MQECHAHKKQGARKPTTLGVGTAVDKKRCQHLEKYKHDSAKESRSQAYPSREEAFGQARQDDHRAGERPQVASQRRRRQSSGESRGM